MDSKVFDEYLLFVHSSSCKHTEVYFIKIHCDLKSHTVCFNLQLRNLQDSETFNMLGISTAQKIVTLSVCSWFKMVTFPCTATKKVFRNFAICLVFPLPKRSLP